MIKDSSISQNFKLHSDKMTIEYFITNMRPISVRTSLRYLVQLILKEVFEIPRFEIIDSLEFAEEQLLWCTKCSF